MFKKLFFISHCCVQLLNAQQQLNVWHPCANLNYYERETTNPELYVAVAYLKTLNNFLNASNLGNLQSTIDTTLSTHLSWYSQTATYQRNDTTLFGLTNINNYLKDLYKVYAPVTITQFQSPYNNWQEDTLHINYQWRSMPRGTFTSQIALTLDWDEEENLLIQLAEESVVSHQ